MASFFSRRRFLTTGTSAGVLTGLGGMEFLSRLTPVSAEELRPAPETVVFQPEIEPLVRILEDTPRERVLEAVADRIRRGTSYREVATALQLAGIRNVQPRPSVGFKFHAVLVVNSAHLAAQSSPPSDRWLPIFWAIDEFKSSQARDAEEGDWTMPAVNELSVSKFATDTTQQYRQAMNDWDAEAADAAAAGLARNGDAAALFPLFAYMGARDFRSIGHKAIFVANGFRTLDHIGWQHAEPVLRSITYAMQNHSGEPNPGKSDLVPDQPWRHNQKIVQRLPGRFPEGEPDSAATQELVRTLRTGTWQDAVTAVESLLTSGATAQTVTDGLYLASAELLLRQRGIVALHAVTSTNALQYAFRRVNAAAIADDRTPHLLLLQNAAFLPMFRDAMLSRGAVTNVEIDQLQSVATAAGDEALDDIFNDVGRQHMRAAGKTLTWLQAGHDGKSFMDAARRLIFLKGENAHDYKFSSAVLEDFSHVSPVWRNRYLAASVLNLRGSRDRDNRLVQRTRAALES